ncbi:MAG: HDOD domain-containing protein, partial [Planctomycetes bacterium]|nr:HDOD domain-containing protein [Planctomycetota bacterium]
MNITSGGFVLAEILEQVDSLPSPPGVAVEVLRLTADDSCCIDDLAQVIARDPVLAAKILKLSNSSLFRRGEDVTTLDRAMMVLGLKTVKLMALSFSLASSLPQASNSGSGFDLQAYWRASLTLAVAARALGVLTRSRNSDEAFLCGLLARIGQLALSEAMPERYRAVIEQSPDNLPDADLERRHLDFDHHDVGAALLESWGMPAMISQAIRLMGTSELPTELDQRSRQLGVVLELARHATTVLCESRKGPALHSLHELCREHHGLDEAEVDSFLIGLQGGIAETAQLLNIDALESIPHDRILEKARMQMVNISLGTALDLQQSSNRARELEQERDAFEEKAMTDKLTGIRNRAFFDETLRDVVVARRNGEYSVELGLLVVDIDHFKKFN